MVADPVKYTLGVYSGKSAAVRAAGSTADANVIVEFDQSMTQADVVTALEKVRELVIEQYHTATS